MIIITVKKSELKATLIKAINNLVYSMGIYVNTDGEVDYRLDSDDNAGYLLITHLNNIDQIENFDDVPAKQIADHIVDEDDCEWFSREIDCYENGISYTINYSD